MNEQNEPSAALRAAIAESVTVCRNRDLIAQAVAFDAGDSAELAELAMGSAIYLKEWNPELPETVEEIAKFITATAALAGIALAEERRRVTLN